jgi:thioesterase domain-containing protein/acyl carrier protein
VVLQLEELWKQVFRRDSIRDDADFFALGGDSLTALELAAETERIFGRAVSIPEFLREPTLAGMARVIQSRSREHPLRSLVAFQTTGRKPPLFVVHGMGGGVVQMRDLARGFDQERPVFALQARGLDGRTPPRRSVEAMAEAYLAEIRAERPAGPYLLAGYSLGGAIAYEMAQQLVAAGERVGGLVLIDTAAPLGLPWRDRWSGRRLLARIALRRLRLSLSGGGRGEYRRSLNRLTLAHLRAFKRYRPLPFPGRVHMIASRQGVAAAASPDHEIAVRIEGHLAKQRAQWGRVARGGLEIHEVAGHHLELLRYPVLEQVIVRLRAILDGAPTGS